MPNMRDMVIRETGNEKPRKNTSRVSFGDETSFQYSLLQITSAEITRPMERQRREAWWNLEAAPTEGLKKSRGKNENALVRTLSASAAMTREMAMAAGYTLKRRRRHNRGRG